MCLVSIPAKARGIPVQSFLKGRVKTIFYLGLCVKHLEGRGRLSKVVLQMIKKSIS